MKIKRYKKAERYMSIFKNDFGFREPYQILLDGTFCQVALAHKVNIQDQLPKYLSGQCKLLTTACVIEETRRLGKPLNGAHQIVSQFALHDCGHEKPLSASKCLSSFIIDSRNKDHYILASQDHKLLQKVSRLSICPLVKLANNALVLQKPPEKVLNKVSRTHYFLANKITDEDRSKAERLKKKESLEELIKPKKRRSKKGPNPLSVKKKKKKRKDSVAVDKDTDMECKKRKRKKKIRLANHVVKLLRDNFSKSLSNDCNESGLTT